MKAWDTNFLLRHLLEDDARQLVIVRRHLQVAEQTGNAVFLPQLVLVEAAWYLRSLLPKPEVLDILSEVQDDQRFLCERPIEVEAAIKKARKHGDFPDHLIAAAAADAKATPVQTFDLALKSFPEFEFQGTVR